MDVVSAASDVAVPSVRFLAVLFAYLSFYLCSFAVVTTLAGSGSRVFADGAGGATFNLPWGVAFDAFGNVLVADSFNNRLRRVTPSGGTLRQDRGQETRACSHALISLALWHYSAWIRPCHVYMTLFMSLFMWSLAFRFLSIFCGFPGFSACSAGALGSPCSPCVVGSYCPAGTMFRLAAVDHWDQFEPLPPVCHPF